METADASNNVFNLAADLVFHTSRPLFITGKAGTGKTTFLKYIKQHTRKNTVVVAPTGVAAINAGGVTMHSFFQLPFGPYIPGFVNKFSIGGEVTDKHALFKNLRINATKREIFEELELLIIDEVSMVRCDMLDAIDTILRHFRKKPETAFGGVQVLYIGDLFQLPPVVSNQEWEILKEYYDSPFFFHSHVVKETAPLYIELKKIYRQNEQRFIDILNRIRDNNPLAEDLHELNKRFNSAYVPHPDEKFIRLTTHNHKADVINEDELKKLSGKMHFFEGEIKGDFSDKMLPTNSKLYVKEGAQIMFIKNDAGNERRYFNGKLAVIKKIAGAEITVSFTNGEDDLKLEKETWKNIRYNYNKETDEIEEEESGSFTQYPIRLAWAITIHKSQGLTFEKAIIDAGASFAAGQVYVALSRCTSLNGLVLHSKIEERAISTNALVLEFARREARDAYLEELLKVEKEKFQVESLIKIFNWDKVLKALAGWKELILGKKLPSQDEALELYAELLAKAQQQGAIAQKFQQQLKQILQNCDLLLINERINKAILYLGQALAEEVLLPLQKHLATLQYVSRIRVYYKEVQVIEVVIAQQLQKLNNIQYRDLVFEKYVVQPIEHRVLTKQSKKGKVEKGASHRDSLNLFKEGKSLEEIAALRNLAVSTIEGHLASFVATGDIAVAEIVSPAKMEAIMKAVKELGSDPGSIRRVLGREYSYGEIRAVLNHCSLS